jgi:hypothetical protein
MSQRLSFFLQKQDAELPFPFILFGPKNPGLGGDGWRFPSKNKVLLYLFLPKLKYYFSFRFQK